MDYNCPHCQASLKRRTIRPPQRANAIAAGDATICCPQCAGGLLLNPHPLEWQLPYSLNFELALYIASAFAMLCAAALSQLIHPLATFIMVMLLCIAAFVWQQIHLYTVTLKDWPRYIKASLRFIDQYQPPT